MSEHNHAAFKDGEVRAEMIPDVLNRIDKDEKEKILQDFDEFRSYLASRIHMAEAMGLNEEQIAVAAQKIADYLAGHEHPHNAEEQLLQELWKVGREDERHMLAHMLVRLAHSDRHLQ
ncbi:DUF3243 domain-containing protein [Paenibacillus sepulcri]|uniref:DUF3243 family protein n=1 Tax=Paenibacillus sepulcri TaxID=359917 RepID=A0ABS7CHZ8_9BACL|nr:DUF3243 family protein [Paenibacillus sepulcri]